MEKVKLMREQAEAIEHALQKVDEYKGNPDKLLRHASMNNVYFRNELHPLNTIDTVNLAKALYIGYEVEPEFKVGDWVVYKHNNTIWEIIGELYGGKVHYDITRDGKYKGSVHKNHIRLATPEEIKQEKERRWWVKHGRDVWELRPGDLLVSDTRVFKEVQEVNNDSVAFAYENHAAMDNLKLYYKVVCFAEDRLDGDFGEGD